MSESSGPLGRWFRRIRPAGQQPSAPDDPATPIAACAPRTMVEVVGTVADLESRSDEARTGLAATLSDGSGSVLLLWMGRTAVPGIDVGRRLRVQGRLADWQGRPAIYNPRYELLP